jgi:3D (Asp-Asp-Asp) domain-containing protein
MFSPAGPMCTSKVGDSWIDEGTSCRARMWPPKGGPRCPVGGFAAAQFVVVVNNFGDTLPVIPAGATLKGGKVLFRIDIRVTLLSQPDCAPLDSLALPSILWGQFFPRLRTNHKEDKITYLSNKTGRDGSFVVRIESREQGILTLADTSGVTSNVPFQVDLGDAWYEDKFLITGYNVCLESDFSGPLVSANGLAAKHKKDFLFSATGVAMQGTGKGTSGGYVHFVSMTTNWHRNANGNPDYINDPAKVNFEDTTTVKGAYGPVTAGTSVAVDPTVIPKKSWVWIEELGERRADDTGSEIEGAHIDNFLGAGKKVVDDWDNLEDKKVKYLGSKK